MSGLVKKIIIAQRGWVFVGDVRPGDNSNVVIENAKCIRRWGTPGKGIGLLAAEGPQPNTTLDDCGTVEIHELAVVAQIICNPEKW